MFSEFFTQVWCPPQGAANGAAGNNNGNGGGQGQVAGGQQAQPVTAAEVQNQIKNVYGQRIK